MKKGHYIILEGGERVGKGTQLDSLEDYFSERKIKYQRLREPGETEVGKIFRNILQERKDFELHPLTEALVYSADRVETFHKIIIPNLKKGISILEDRSWPSTYVYQGELGKLNQSHKGLINYINEIATFGILPDILFIIDGKQETLVKKIESKDRMEEKVSKNPNAIDEGYLKIAKMFPKVSVVIPYQKGNPKAMQQEIRHHLKQRLGI